MPQENICHYTEENCFETFSYWPCMLILLQKRAPANRFWHRRRQSVDLDGAIKEDEFVVGTAPSTGDLDILSSSNSASSTSLHVQVSYQTEQNLKEEWAATVIQTAFRAFLVLYAVYFTECLSSLEILMYSGQFYCITILLGNTYKQ